MEFIVIDENRIGYPYIRKRGLNEFSDTIVLTLEEKDLYTEEQITKMMDDRFENWYSIVTYVAPEKTGE